MKKTFKKAIACLLAVLMVVFSVPFTALAAEPYIWWTDEDLKNVTAEPDYIGYDDLYNSGEFEYDLAFGDEIYPQDGDPMLMENFKGAVFITASDVTSDINTFYGKNASNDYTTVKNAGRILDPSKLKAGTYIAVSIELGGFDALWSSQACGTFDTTKLQAVYNNRGNWKAATTSSQAIITKTDSVFYSAAATALSTYNCDPTGSFSNALLAVSDDPMSNYVGNRPFGEYGLMFPVMTFKVLEDCDLRDALTIDGPNTYAAPYSYNLLEEGRLAVGDRPGYTYGLIPVIYPDIQADDPQPTHEHTYTSEVTPPTCTVDGYTTYTCNNEDGLGAVGDDVYTEPGAAKLGHDFQWKELEKTTATCTEAGTVTKQLVCTRCDATDGDPVTEDVGEPLGHDYETVEVSSTPATCTDAATVTTKDVCSRCDDEKEPVTTTVGEPLGHDYIVNEEVTTAPTFTTEGVKTITTTCSRCDYKDVKTEPIPVLEGYAITVPATTLGTVTVNGETVSEDGATVYVAKDAADVTLTATPVADAEFLGWKVNDQIVSTDAEYTFTAVADVTIEPVFQEEVVVNEFTVTFTDKWGNILSTQTVTSGADIVKPVDPTIDGYTFAGWSLTDEQIAALEADATILAVYNHDASKVYTVTAEGATITGEGVEAKNTVQAEYDALVTVTAEGATAWKMNGAIVGYGDTYTFYVGSDVVVEAVYDAVTATPTVAAVSTTEIGTPGAIQAAFLATRTMADGYTYSNAGFVYGKNLADNDITLADVDGTTVKAHYCTTNVEQFALNYGLAAQTGTMTARAFLAYVDNATGESHVVYAEPQTYTYR